MDYRSRLSTEDRAWFDQWTKEEYDCSYEKKILSSEQATVARGNKARQARDVLNQAIYGLEKVLNERLQVNVEKPKKESKRKVLTPLDLAERRVAKKAKSGAQATKQQMELSFVAYSTACLCMDAVKPGDVNTRNNIAMAKMLFGKMSGDILDDYVVRFGISAAQQLMGLGTTETPLSAEHTPPSPALSVVEPEAPPTSATEEAVTANEQ